MEEDIEEFKRLFYSDRLTQYGKRKLIEYYEKRIKELEEKNKKKSIEIICYQEELENSIPVSLVKEKIEELNKQYDFYNSDRRETKSIAKGYYIAIQKLEELLEKRK